jgi:catalase
VSVTGDWGEEFIGGSAAEERIVLQRLADEIGFVQRQNRRRQGDGVTRRAFHAKTIAGIANAEFLVSPAISRDLARGVLQPGVVHDAVVRFSSASGLIRSDNAKDLRGVAIRVRPAQGVPQDFLLTNAPASHARDGPQFMAVAKAAAAGPLPLVVLRLLRSIGPRETMRVLRALARATGREIGSVATERYWSRAPFAIGPVAVKFKLEPLAAAAARRDAGPFRKELEERLRAGPVRFNFEAQRFVDDDKTPIEDGTVEWREEDAPFEPVGELVLPQQDIGTAEGRAADATVEALAFNPWLRAEEIRPIGGLNRARRFVYEASVRNRTTTRDGP